MRTRWSSALTAAVLAGGCLTGMATAATTAGATQVTVVNGVLHVRATPGAANVMVLSSNATDVLISEDVGLTAAPPCIQLTSFRANCPAAGLTAIVVETFDQTDNLAMGQSLPVRPTIRTGSGDDHVIGSDGAEFFDLGEGNDDAWPRFGADVVVGGSGTDLVTYPDYSVGVVVRLDNKPNDGMPNEHDDIRSDVENIEGSSKDDVLIGSGAANRLVGAGGNDTLRGLGGNDSFDDNAQGADIISGGTGTDRMSYSDAGRDNPVRVSLDNVANDGRLGEKDNVATDVEIVEGGAGNDVLIGNNLNNLLRGLGGNDTINALGGNDVVIGDTGTDHLLGGTGIDTASYQTYATPVAASLDGKANDGRSGEGDLIRLDIENLTGGSGNDTLLGNNIGNLLRGLAGNDRLYGRPGNDTLLGDTGADQAFGEAGSDTCHAEARNSCP